DASGWSATSYRNVAPYVYSSEATASILQLLDARPGERILDFGCGSGEVTAEIARLVEPQGVVVGVDTSESMILSSSNAIYKCLNSSRSFRPTSLESATKSSATAALHWCSRDPLGVLANVRRILKVGGLFVAEMGGHGNIADVRNALHGSLLKRGIDPVARDPWFFPTPDQYTQLLKSANLHPLSVALQPRETPIADLTGWVRLFCGHNFLEGIEPEDEQEIVREVVATCRKAGRCRWDEQKKLWYLDYVRLRVTATKLGD
ncbi:S-adenosyl-L-methionine-dependent methyltransferase, partial [Lactarius vividus]